MNRGIKSMLSCCLFVLLIFLCLPGTAHAGYLDPGSGSILVQSIAAVLAAFGRVVAKCKLFFRFGR